MDFRKAKLSAKLNILKVLEQEQSSSVMATIRQKRPYHSRSGGNSNRTRSSSREASGAVLRDVEQALLRWLRLARARKMALSVPLLKEKAERFAALLGNTTFRAVPTWLERFKANHNVSSHLFRSVRRLSGSQELDPTVHWLEHALPKLLAKYDPCDVFVADEAGLFFEMSPTEAALALKKGGECSGGQRSGERLTVLLCCNMDGSERLDPLVVGKAFLTLRGVDYHSDAGAWLTADVFGMWLRDLDDRMRSQRRRVLLVLDHCNCHHLNDSPSKWDAVRVEFQPDHLAVGGPMDAGIVRQVKRVYRSRFLQRMLLGRKGATTTVQQAVQLLMTGWKRLESETIVASFRRAGFRSFTDEESSDPIPLPSEAEAKLWTAVKGQLDVPAEMEFVDYVGVDDRLATSAPFTDEEIVASVLNGDSCGVSDDDDEEEEKSRGSSAAAKKTMTTPVTFDEALSAINNLRIYLQSRENVPGDLQDHLFEVEASVLNNAP